MVNLYKVAALLGVSALSACGGSSTGLSFAEIQTLVTDLNDDAQMAGPTADIPEVGSATYSGVSIVAETTEDAVPVLEAEETSFVAVGEITIDVDFAAEELSGVASNFYEFEDPTVAATETDGIAIDGTITFANDGTGSGSLTKSNGEVAEYTFVDGAAEFAGENAEFVLGLAEGSSSAAGRDDRNALGLFIAEIDG